MIRESTGYIAAHPDDLRFGRTLWPATLAHRSPSQYLSGNGCVAFEGAPFAINKLTTIRQEVCAAIIFAQDFKRLVRRRRALVEFA
jgi:hypothetical protein